MSAPRSTRSDVFGAIAAGLIVVLFSFLLLWHDPLVFWNDDYQVSILPVFADMARSWNEGHWPLLSPYSWVCSNLAGEFQYGTFSIFINALVILIWKLPLTFPQQAAALSIAHLFVLATGAFLLAQDRLRMIQVPSPQPSPSGRGEERKSDFREVIEPPFFLRRSRAERDHYVAEFIEPSPAGRGGRQGRRVRETSHIPLSIFVALVATLSGWIICWGATDWFGALGAFAWVPWAWWGLERSLNRERTRYRFLWPAPFVYLLVTGGFPYTVVMLLLLIAWLACRALALSGGGSIKSLLQTRNLMSIWPMIFGTALGFGLSAPAWLAIFNYVQGSAREVQSAAVHWQWMVPIRALPGFILPCWTVNWVNFSTRYLPHTGTELACGLVAPATLLAGLWWRGRVLVRQIGWDFLLLGCVLLLAMLPSAGMFRWSFRWLPLFHLILALCAAEALCLKPESQTPTTGTMALALVVLTAIAMSILHTTGQFAFPLTWILIFIAAIWAAVEILVRKQSVNAWLPAGITFVVLLATYLCLPTNCGVPKYRLAQELTKADRLDPQRLYLSLYPWAEVAYRSETRPGPAGQIVRPGSTSMWAGLRFINGYSPILASGVAREFECTVHGEIDWSVGEYLLEQQAGPSGELARLGVDGIVVAREFDFEPQPASEWEVIFANDEGRVFHRTGAPFARVRSDAATISRIFDSRNRVEADVDIANGGRAALIRFSRPYFPGYEARLDGKKVKVDSYRGLFPTVELPPGSHGRLVLEYRPVWLIGGVTAACICASILAVGIFCGSGKDRSRCSLATSLS